MSDPAVVGGAGCSELAGLVHRGRVPAGCDGVLRRAWSGTEVRCTEVAGLVLWATGPRASLPASPDRSGTYLAHLSRLDQPVPGSPVAGADPLRARYEAVGRSIVADLRGDWLLVAWEPGPARLTLARDPLGVTELFYSSTVAGLVFSTELSTLRRLPFVAGEIDEVEFTRAATGQLDPDSDRTLVASIRRLLPGHILTSTRAGVHTRRYWHPADVPLVPTASSAEHAAGLREAVAAAVACRLPPTGGVACQLSGGLDSGMVAALAGRTLTAAGRTLTGLTAAPDAPEYGAFHPAGALVDEWPLAAATAATVPHLEHRRVTGAAQSPVAAVRRWLALGGEPVRNPNALRWLMELADTARELGCTTLLTGDSGNSAFSWRGPVRHPAGSVVTDLRGRAGRRLPRSGYARLRARRDPDWFRNSPLHPRLGRAAAGRAVLAAQRPADDGRHGQRLMVLTTARTAGQARAQSRVHGIDVLDPTADLRVVSHSLSVPVDAFVDPATGTDRMLARAATVGLLPDEVRLNRIRSKQGVDLVPRLRDSSEEVSQVLDELAAGRANDYVDLVLMRKAWAHAQQHDDVAAHRGCALVLMRGIGLGLWANSVAVAS